MIALGRARSRFDFEAARNRIETLRPRLFQAAWLISQGLSNPQIAEVMGVCTKTVENSINSISSKLGLPDATEERGGNRVIIGRLFWELEACSQGETPNPSEGRTL